MKYLNVLLAFSLTAIFLIVCPDAIEGLILYYVILLNLNQGMLK